MPILAVYNQTFTTSQLATYQWTFRLQPRMKTKPNSRFIIRLNSFIGTQTGIVPAISNNQLNIYISNTELCAGAAHQLLAPSPLGTVTNNELMSAGTNQVFICNEFPLSPIVFTARYTSTLLSPTAVGSWVFNTIFTIYEFDGDIPDTVLN